MPEDNKKDVYDALIKSHHKMISKIYEGAIDVVLERMYQDSDFDDDASLSYYADQIKDSLRKARNILLLSDIH